MKTIVLLLAVVALTACNTIEGIGKDLKKGGEKIEKAAK
ncbi:MAG: entericidin A/B family lipoprotein [Nitrosomonadales bacterium]